MCFLLGAKDRRHGFGATLRSEMCCAVDYFRTTSRQSHWAHLRSTTLTRASRSSGARAQSCVRTVSPCTMLRRSEFVVCCRPAVRCMLPASCTVNGPSALTVYSIHSHLTRPDRHRTVTPVDTSAVVVQSQCDQRTALSIRSDHSKLRGKPFPSTLIRD